MTLGGSQILRRATRLDFLEGLGVAIGQRHVALAHVVKRLVPVTLQHSRVLPLPPMDQVDARRSALAAAVATFRAEHSIDADRTYVTLPRGCAVLSRLSLPAAARNDLQNVVDFEIDRLLPIARGEIYYDCLVREAGPDKLEVMVVSVPRRVVAEHLAALELAEVRARSVAITAAGILDFVGFCADSAAAAVVALIDDGGTLELDYVSRRKLGATHLVRKNEVGSLASVTRLVTEETLAVGAAAEGVKLYAWQAEARAAAQAGAHAEPTLLPADVLQSGPDLMRRAEGTLRAPEGFFADPDPALVPAIGAALGAVREGDCGLNLLPPEERRAVEERAPVVTFLLVAVLVLVTGVWLASAMVKDHSVDRGLHAELDELEPQTRAVHRNEEEAKALREKLRVLTQGDQRRVSTLLRELTEVVPADAYLTTFRVRNDRIELEGFARSASDLVPLLEKSPHFKNAQFTSPVTKVQNNQERFSLTTEIEE